MKKRIAILLALAITLSLGACSSKPAGSNTEPPSYDFSPNSENTDAPSQFPTKTGILSVVHPDFALSNGLIEPVTQLTEAPEQFIPLTSEEEFDKIRLNPTANYILMADMDLSQINFETIRPNGGFSGILDGNGYTVSNVNTTLLGHVDGGVIRNLKISGDLMECNASLAENVESSTIVNCSFTGSIEWYPGHDRGTTNGTMAGLISSMEDTVLYSCYNEGSVFGDSSTAIGGIVGHVDGNCTILNCFNAGTLTNQNGDRDTDLGGIVGYSDTTNGSSLYLSYCRNTGKLENHSDIVSAGIVGHMSVRGGGQVLIDICYNEGVIEWGNSAIAYVEDIHEDSYITITNCYNYSENLEQVINIADCSSKEPGINNISIAHCYNIGDACYGGISGNCKNLQDCYYLSDADIDRATKDGALFSDVKGLTLDEMKKQDSFVGFNFDTVWQMGGNDYPYPVFKAVSYLPEDGIG